MSASLSAAPAPLASRAFARGYAVTMRPYLLFVSGITGLCGLSFAAPRPVAATLLLGVVFFLSYGFGQALTDCFQTDTDALSSPYRPLVRGAIRRRDVLAVSLAGLALSGAILGAFHPLNLALGVLAALGLATYTPFKRRWWGGPFYNAGIVGILFLIGYFSGGPTAPDGPGFPAGFAAALGAVVFGYADFVLTGYFKDVSADRATGYRTLPVVAGRGPASLAAHSLALALLLGVGTAGVPAFPADRPLSGSIPALLFGVAGITALLTGHIRLQRLRAETEAHRAIAPVVHAYILLLSALTAANRPGWAPALAIFYAGFVVALRRRPAEEQI